MSAPRSARALPALVTRWGRGARRPASLDAARALADPARVHRILVIKPHDQLGDFLVAVPAIAALRARYPRARLDLITREYMAPLARRVAGVDRVYVITRPLGPGMPGSGPRAVWGARVPRPELAVVLNSVSRSRSADLLAALSGARVVVGRSVVGAGPLPADASGAATGGARIAVDPVYDLDLPFGAGSDHQVDRLLDLVRWTTGTAEAATEPALALSAADRVAGVAALAAAGLITGSPLVGLHPAAANPLKCWPVGAFADWGALMAAGPKPIQLAVLDTPKDPGPAAALLAALAHRGVRAAHVPPLPLATFAAACAHLDLLACNDSGVLHIAAAVGARTLSFHSLGRPAEWAPRGPRARALHHEPIAGIGTDDAVIAGQALLGGS